MATEHQLFSVNFKANADLSAKQFFVVKQTAADVVDLCAAATDRAIGVLGNAPKANQAAQVGTDGVLKVVSDGSGSRDRRRRPAGGRHERPRGEVHHGRSSDDR
jgi:hypothetical protein